MQRRFNWNRARQTASPTESPVLSSLSPKKQKALGEEAETGNLRLSQRETLKPIEQSDDDSTPPQNMQISPNSSSIFTPYFD
jgi:hypothetical protein